MQLLAILLSRMQTRSGKTYTNASSSLKESKPKEVINVNERLTVVTSTSVSNSTIIRRPSGFTTPMRISNELAKFLGKPAGTEMARTDVSRHINTYIRTNNLHDPQNGRIINADTKLQKLLRLGKNDELTYFNLQKYMRPHFHRE
jgi:chromatin remodeling complex protein RSC6